MKLTIMSLEDVTTKDGAVIFEALEDISATVEFDVDTWIVELPAVCKWMDAVELDKLEDRFVQVAESVRKKQHADFDLERKLAALDC